MGTHPIFESDFDCLTDVRDSISVTSKLVRMMDDDSFTMQCYEAGEWDSQVKSPFDYLSNPFSSSPSKREIELEEELRKERKQAEPERKQAEDIEAERKRRREQERREEKRQERER